MKSSYCQGAKPCLLACRAVREQLHSAAKLLEIAAPVLCVVTFVEINFRTEAPIALVDQGVRCAVVLKHPANYCTIEIAIDFGKAQLFKELHGWPGGTLLLRIIFGTESAKRRSSPPPVFLKTGLFPIAESGVL